MFIAVLFIIAKTWEQSNFQTGEGNTCGITIQWNTTQRFKKNYLNDILEKAKLTGTEMKSVVVRGQEGREG